MSRHQPGATLAKQRGPCGLPTENSSKSFWHSQPSSLLLGHRSTRELPETADVVVIGSGITGTSIAHHLLNDGNEDRQKPTVVMLEAREACWGATGRVQIRSCQICLQTADCLSRTVVTASQSSSSTRTSQRSAASNWPTSKHSAD